MRLEAKELLVKANDSSELEAKESPVEANNS
jgi:hypothetical protein